MVGQNFTCLPKTQSGNGVYLPEAKSLSASIFIKRNQKIIETLKPVWAFAQAHDVITHPAIRIAGDTKRRLFSVQRPNGLSTWKAKVCVNRR